MVEIRVYTGIEIEELKATALKIIPLLSSDFDVAIDTLIFLIKKMYEDNVDEFIDRYRFTTIK